MGVIFPIIFQRLLFWNIWQLICDVAIFLVMLRWIIVGISFIFHLFCATFIPEVLTGDIQIARTCHRRQVVVVEIINWIVVWNIHILQRGFFMHSKFAPEYIFFRYYWTWIIWCIGKFTLSNHPILAPRSDVQALAAPF